MNLLQCIKQVIKIRVIKKYQHVVVNKSTMHSGKHEVQMAGTRWSQQGAG
jgi:hypothetical protein